MPALSAPTPIRALVLIALYVGLTAFAVQFIAMPGSVTLFWPAAGLGLAAVIRYGLRWAWFVPVSVLIAHLTISPVPTAFIPFSLASNTLGVLAGGWLALRDPLPEHVDIRFGYRTLRGGMLMSVVGAAIGVAGMVSSGLIRETSVMDALVKWTLGDFLGIVSVAPALLMFGFGRHKRAPSPSRDYGPESEKMAWNFALLASYVLLAWGGVYGSPYALGLSALPLTIMVWSALRFEPIRTAVAVLLTEMLIGTLAGLGLAGFQPPTRALDSAILLSYLSLHAILPIILVLTVHERRIAARNLVKRANSDSLTGLPNRSAFEAKVQKLFADPAEPPMALAYLDLDNLALINDTSSHAAGDVMIVGIAGVLGSSLNEGDILAHLGADEFVVLLRNSSGASARETANVLARAVESYRCEWRGNVLSTTVSIGVVPFRPGDANFPELLSKADAACFTAKEQGGNRVYVAGPLASDILDRTTAMHWALRIRESLDKHRFDLYAQTISPLRPASRENGCHFELLLRLRGDDPDSVLMPDQFIPAAVRFRLGVRVDREVINLALDFLELNAGYSAQVATCSINLSAEALVDEGFSGFLVERLRRSSFPARKLCFEITETSAVRDLARAQRFIDTMRALGCRFALDDFGTGFCSFSYLRSLDVDYFKIDGSFVREMHSSPLAAEVVRSITHIAHLLDKQTIAEHTESQAQRTALRELGVDFAQGYAIDRPTPIADYFKRLSE